MSILALAALSLAPLQDPTVEGPWRAWLDCPGGELPFGIEVESRSGELHAALVNGSERIDVPRTTLANGALVLDMPHYDSRIEARLVGDSLEGSWRRRRGLEKWTEMAFHARRGALSRFTEVDAAPSDEVDGRWRVEFESSTDPAVGVFSSGPDGKLEGTFLTSTGDYRFLAGDFAGGELRLSCFDGAHAFLFRARLFADGTLAGDFWSRDSWHETWTAHRDESAALPDAFAQTVWRDDWSLGDVIFPDLDGAPRSLADPEFAGKARILQVFGSWCPNCNDEARYLAQLQQQYGDRGLSILGLAFELTGDFERDAQQVRRYLERNRVEYPVLIAGTANKKLATRAFPALDFVRSYPTTIFLRQDGSVRAVHSGFNGPATGEEHLRLRAEFEGLIEELLREPADDHEDSWAFLRDRRFLEEGATGPPLDLTFQREGERFGVTVRSPSGEGTVREQALHLSGNSLVFGDEVLRIDREADALLDPRSFERRFVPASVLADPPASPGWAEWLDKIATLRGAARREGIVAFTKGRLADGLGGTPHVASWLEDDSLQVQLAAIWSAGTLGERSIRGALIERLADPNAAVRRESATALGRLGPDSATRSELERLAGDPDPFVRRAAERALREPVRGPELER